MGGLDMSGLDILYSTASSRPSQIMRQTIPNNDMRDISQYEANIGLDISNKHWFVKPAKSGRDREDTLIHNRVYTNTIEDIYLI